MYQFLLEIAGGLLICEHKIEFFWGNMHGKISNKNTYPIDWSHTSNQVMAGLATTATSASLSWAAGPENKKKCLYSAKHFKEIKKRLTAVLICYFGNSND